MAGSFETTDQNPEHLLKPLRVPTRHEDIYQAAQELVDDLPGWTLVDKNDETETLRCTRKARLLGGESTVTIRVEGPDDIPNTTVNLKSESNGGLLSHDKKNVLEFMKLFHRRVSDAVS